MEIATDTIQGKYNKKLAALFDTGITGVTGNSINEQLKNVLGIASDIINSGENTYTIKKENISTVTQDKMTALKDYTTKWNNKYNATKSDFNEIANQSQGQPTKDKEDFINKYLDVLATYHFLKLMVIICIHVKMNILIKSNESNTKMKEILTKIGKTDSTNAAKDIEDYINNLKELLKVSVNMLSDFSTETNEF